MANMTNNPNAADNTGHRQRLKHQYLTGGLDSFDNARALELLLTFAIPRKDTHALAKRLLEAFGTYSGVLEAPVEELQRINGMTPNAAILVHLVLDTSRRHLIERSGASNILRTVDDCGEYLVPYFYGSRDEEVYLLSLDAKGKVMNCQKIGKGSVNSANIPIRRIVEAALRVNATTVVLAHNHPSGIALPSQEDLLATEAVQDGLRAVGIQLLDHIIVADDDFVSLKQSHYMK